MIKTFTCKHCNDPFERAVYPSGKQCTYEFCSPSCRNKARGLKPVNCPVCNTPFIPQRINGAKGEPKRFCSRKCASFAQRGKPSTNPYTHSQEDREFVKRHYVEKGAEWVAEALGYTKGAIYNLAHKIGVSLSYEARLEKLHNGARAHMLANNPMKNKKTAAKVGKKVSQKYWNDPEYRERFLTSKANANKHALTKPELKCKDILEELGISFQYQHLVKPKFIVDFLIGSKVVLQVDGEYWHGHPRFEPLTERQKKQQARDKAQTAYLTKCGYRVVRVWESGVTKENITRLLRV
jgi:very-short-patch-repair endonuclease